MIIKDQIMPLLLGACLSFSEKWKEHCDFYEEDLLYVALADFARHIVELYRSGQIHEFPALFDTIERLHLEGDAYVREAATIGLLESIQNIAGDGAEEFQRYLKPETEKWWRQLNDFWEGKIPFVGATINEA